MRKNSDDVIIIIVKWLKLLKSKLVSAKYLVFSGKYWRSGNPELGGEMTIQKPVFHSANNVQAH